MPTIKNRRATKAQWALLNPVLAAGEIGYEIDTNKHKIGNGLSPWGVLKYFIDEAALNATYITAEGVRAGGPSASRPSRPLVAFVFDDGTTQDLSVVKPILDAAAIKATFAISTQFVGGTGRLTWDQIRQLAADGHEISNHGTAHATLGAITDRATILAEVFAPLAIFHAEGLYPTGFTYAGGTSNPTVREIVRENHDYALAINGSAAVAGNAQPFKTYALDRKAITNVSTLASHTANVDTAIAGNQFLIFYSHPGYDLDETAQQKLRDLIAYVKAANVPIVTVELGLNLVGNVVDVGDYPGGSSYTVVGSGGLQATSGGLVRTLALNALLPTTKPYDFPVNTVTYASVNASATGWPVAATADIVTTRMATGSGAYVLQQFLTGAAIHMRRGASDGQTWGTWKSVALA